MRIGVSGDEQWWVTMATWSKEGERRSGRWADVHSRLVCQGRWTVLGIERVG